VKWERQRGGGQHDHGDAAERGACAGIRGWPLEQTPVGRGLVPEPLAVEEDDHRGLALRSRQHSPRDDKRPLVLCIGNVGVDAPLNESSETFQGPVRTLRSRCRVVVHAAASDRRRAPRVRGTGAASCECLPADQTSSLT
jgi:hypothetical protein